MFGQVFQKALKKKLILDSRFAPEGAICIIKRTAHA
tara:strand:+ start:145 stop:252 length:108 start_codon:yes stop_codon:yes gene_type:complete